MNVRTQILSSEKGISTMDEAFSAVVTDENQRGCTAKRVFSENVQYDTALYAKKMSGFRSEPYNSDKYKFSRKGVKLNLKIRCDNCWFFGHKKEACYHLNGYPNDKEPPRKQLKTDLVKKRNADQANTATGYSLSEEEYKVMQNFFMKNAGICFNNIKTNLACSSCMLFNV